jgi:hypothetical protein
MLCELFNTVERSERALNLVIKGGKEKSLYKANLRGV